MATKTMKIGLSNTDKTNMKNEIYGNTISALITPYSSSSTYAVGDFCSKDSVLYKCTTAITTAEAWNSAHWTTANLNDVIDDVNDAVDTINDKANVDGNYPTMSVGQAQSISSDRVIEDADEACPPITFGTAGGNAEITTGFAKFQKLLGNSVVWNQLAGNASNNLNEKGITISYSNGVFTVSGTATDTYDRGLLYSNMPSVAGHKYLVMHTLEGVSNDNNNGFNVYCYGSYWGVQYDARCAIHTAGSSGDGYFSFYLKVQNGIQITERTFRVYAVDLTLMFGAGNEPTSLDDDRIVWLKEQLELAPAYNAGQIISSKSYSLDSIGENQWDEVAVSGTISTSTGIKQEYDGTTTLVNKNPIRVRPNEIYVIKKSLKQAFLFFYDVNGNVLQYVQGEGIDCSAYNLSALSTEYEEESTFNTPEDAYWMNIRVENSMPYDNSICIRLYWDTPNRPYVAYDKQTVALPNVELGSVPQVNSGGSIIGEIRSELYSEGGGKRKTWKLHLGDLEWFAGDADYGFFEVYVTKLGVAYGRNGRVNQRYVFQGSTGSAQNSPDNTVIFLSNGSLLAIKDTERFTGKTGEQVKALLNGYYIEYELKEYEDIDTTENAGWTELVKVDNYGTLLFNTSPAQVPQVPQAYYIEYTVNLVEFLDSLFVKSGGDFDEVVTQEELEAVDDKHDALNDIAVANLGGLLKQQLASKNSLDFDDLDFVDLSDLTWSYNPDSNYQCWYNNDYDNVIEKPSQNSDSANILATMLKTMDVSSFLGNNKKCICFSAAGTLIVRNGSSTEKPKGLMAYKKAS